MNKKKWTVPIIEELGVKKSQYDYDYDLAKKSDNGCSGKDSSSNKGSSDSDKHHKPIKPPHGGGGSDGKGKNPVQPKPKDYM